MATIRTSGKVDLERVNQTQLAHVLGVDSRTVREWCKELGAPRNEDRSYSLPDFVQWYVGWLKAREGQVPEDSGEGLSPAARKDKYAAENQMYAAELKRLQIERLQGHLLPRDEVREVLRQVAGRLRKVGSMLAHRFGNDALGLLEEGLDDCDALVVAGLKGAEESAVAAAVEAAEAEAVPAAKVKAKRKAKSKKAAKARPSVRGTSGPKKTRRS